MAKIVKRNLPNGVWQQLLPHALRILEDIKAHGTNELFWTLGGGTVLMFRYAHRLSKDIDIFVPDPQYLGFVTPRLSDVAAEVASQYVEDQSSYVKLIRREREIDFVAAPNLTEYPYEFWEINGQEIRVETAVEIVAKKLWYRGDRAQHEIYLTSPWSSKGNPNNFLQLRHYSKKTQRFLLSKFIQGKKY